MDSVLERLASRHPAVARAFLSGWDVPAGEWAAVACRAPADPGFEPALREALSAQLAPRLGDRADALVAAIESSGVVLTSHHVCPTNGPTFAATDLLTAFGHPGPILVLAWSGVPMSNSAVSGALCYSAAALEDLLVPGGEEYRRQRKAARDRERDGVAERRITLMPPQLRDALVYRCPIPERVRAVLAEATEGLRAVIPLPRAGEDYSDWALRACEGLQRRLLGRDDIWYVDMNRVSARYLAQVVADRGHTLSLLGDSRACEKLARSLPGLPWFYRREIRRGRERIRAVFGAPEDLIDRLRDGTLCPGLVPVFAALRLLSRVRLLGGFRQVEYLEAIARAWLRSGAVPRDSGVPGSLMTGRACTAAGEPIYPLDVALGAVPLEAVPSPKDPMAVFWRPIAERMVGAPL